jgi:SAF domain
MSSITMTRPASATLRASTPAFRPSSRSRVRLAVGALLSLAAIGVMLTVFASADKRMPVLQVVRDVPAGTQLSAGDLRIIEVSVDSSLAVVPSSQMVAIVGQYAKVRIVAGSLVATPMLQGAPLVAPGAAIVAVSVPSGELPVGLRERSRVLLVFPQSSAADVAPEPVEGRVVGLPQSTDTVTGRESLSIEVAVGDAAVLAAAAEVRVVLLDPGVDAASVTP